MKISGPISVHVLQHGDKRIVLWGDRHGDRTQYCRCVETMQNNKTCMLISSFIKNIEDKYDLFIESGWYSKGEKRHLVGKKFVEVNAISNMANTFYHEMYFHGRNNKKHRVHFTDIRREKTIRPLTNIIDNLMSILFHNKNIDDYSFIKTLQKYSTVKQLRIFVETLVNDKTHKIGKQLIKLSQEEQRIVGRFHKDMCRTLLETTQKYDDSHYQLFNIHKNDYTKDLLSIFNNLLIWLSYLKDIYTICRMLYYMKKTNIIMSYDGDYHTQVYKDFFTLYYPHTRTIFTKKGIKRCITLPLQIARQISPNTMF